MRILRMVTMCLITIVTCAALTSCGDDDNGLSQNPDSGDTAPQSLEDTELVLYKESGKQFMGITHQDSGIYLDTKEMVDYSDRYAPTYRYSAYGNTANYVLTATKMTFIPYYNTYVYGQFTFDIILLFDDPRSGTYTGTQSNADGTLKSISGKFTLRYL